MNISVVRLTRETHYPIVCKWWAQHGFPILMWDFLPPTARMALGEDGTPIAAAWLYMSDAPLSWLEYLVRNPELSRDVTNIALDAVIEALGEQAKLSGAKVMLSCTDKASLKSRFERLGFSKADENVTHYVRRL